MKASLHMIKILLISILLGGAFLFLPSLSFAEFGEGVGCTATGGLPGTCWDRQNHYCGTYYDAGNYCPGDDSVQCCVANNDYCNPPGQSGACHNNAMYPGYLSGGANNGNIYACNGTWYTGAYCYGNGDVQCCVPAPPTATPTPVPPTPTPTPPACPNDPTPAGTIISTGVPVTASSYLNNDSVGYSGGNIVDGVLNTTKYWNSGRVPPGWVEIDLGAPQTVVGMVLYVIQLPNGGTTTQILTGTSPNPTTVSKTLNCLTSDKQVINVSFSPALTNVRYIRVSTISGPSWVAWNEISVFGSSPGSQTTTPGIIYSGNGSASFGQGRASVNDWVVGGLSYPEVYQATNHKSYTAYQYILGRVNTGHIPITNMTSLSGCANLSNCTLPANLTNGVYQANGNVTLNGYSFPTNKNYVFLVNGDLKIQGNIVVPNGSTAFFTASNDIIVDKVVGTATNLFPLPAGQLQGIYSADRDFRILGNNDCVVGKDKMLNVEGAIVTNALGNGGNFRIQRDLCGDNPKFPAFTVRARLDMLLNMPEVLMKRSTTLREDAP